MALVLDLQIPTSPYEKGHVERSIEYVIRQIFSKKDEFSGLEEAKDLREYFGRRFWVK